jgi:hypothetical protein
VIRRRLASPSRPWVRRTCILAHRRQPSRRIAGKKIREKPIETKREIESIARTSRLALLTAAAHKAKAQHRSWVRSA